MMIPPIKLIRMDLIDEPAHAMRIAMNEERLRELAASIAATGLQNPIAIMQGGGRFEIIAGHRRYVACQRLGRAEIESRDYTGSGLDPIHIRMQENLHRDEISDGEMIVYLQECREKYNMDLAGMQLATGKSENWIATRLAIYRGDKRVHDALVAGTIKLSQATSLNRFPEDYIAMYLEQAIQSGAPSRVIDNWYKDFKLMNLPQQLPAGGPVLVDPAALPGVASLEPCALCRERHSTWKMITVVVHTDCLKGILDAIEQAGVNGGVK